MKMSSFHWVIRILNIFRYKSFIRYVICRYLLDSILYCTQVFILMKFNLSVFFSFGCLVSCLGSHCLILDHKGFTVTLPSKSFTVITLTFMSSIYFCVWCEVGTPIPPSARGWPDVSAPFIEKAVPFLLLPDDCLIM